MPTADPYLGREILGQFRILERIGSGGMGSVYKAEQPSMDRLVAVKILHPKLASRKDLVSRFRREARAMSHLTHPNTVRVFLYGQLDDGSLYIVMEYLSGKNLAQTVRAEGPMASERALPVMIQACGALEEAHRMGIVHRDLKPENIFLSTQGGIQDYAKVLDFGLAKVTEREMRPGSVVLTQEGMVFGTPEFMSPEQAQGKTLDPRSDIYSLGVILYELLTGKLPFSARVPMEYISLHVNAQPIPLAERAPQRSFPRGLQAVMDRALMKNPDDRFQTAAEFGEALKGLIQGVVPPTSVIPPPQGGGGSPPPSGGKATFGPGAVPPPEASPHFERERAAPGASPLEGRSQDPISSGPSSAAGPAATPSPSMERPERRLLGPTELGPAPELVRRVHMRRRSPIPTVLLGILVIVLGVALALALSRPREGPLTTSTLPVGPAPVIPIPVPIPTPQPVTQVDAAVGGPRDAGALSDAGQTDPPQPVPPSPRVRDAPSAETVVACPAITTDSVKGSARACADRLTSTDSFTVAFTIDSSGRARLRFAGDPGTAFKSCMVAQAVGLRFPTLEGSCRGRFRFP